MINNHFNLTEKNAQIENSNRMMLKNLVNITVGRRARELDTGLPSN